MLLSKNKQKPVTEIDQHVLKNIAGTNGRHYKSLIDNLNTYPIPEIPIARAVEGSLFLDIGVGWGRWMVAAAKKGYLPIGIDVKPESCFAASNVLNQHGYNGFLVVADLNNLPFKENTFDFIWSFSVLQHTHRTRIAACIKESYRILNANGEVKIEFPTSNGLWNKAVKILRSKNEEDDYDSWCVRYFSIKELKKLFTPTFSNVHFLAHCFGGIGILKEDLKHVKLIYKPWIILSLGFTFLANKISPLIYLADSIYITAQKKAIHTTGKKMIKTKEDFYNILQCPITKESLEIDGDFLVSAVSRNRYPIINNVPHLMESYLIKNE